MATELTIQSGSIENFLGDVLIELILPPTFSIGLMLAGIVLLARHRGLGLVCLALSWASLYAASLWPVADVLREDSAILRPLAEATAMSTDAQAIVVLGAGMKVDAVEYGGDAVHWQTLERIHYSAWLHRQSGLPILVTGGSLETGASPVGELMAASLREEFSVPVRWVESQARTTLENASRSVEILGKDGVCHVILVTHSYHMRRAVSVFEHMGLRVTPAPIMWARRMHREFQAYLPHAEAFSANRIALREYFGGLWYRLRYGTSPAADLGRAECIAEEKPGAAPPLTEFEQSDGRATQTDGLGVSPGG